MGVDYYARTIVGLRLIEKDLIDDETNNYINEYRHVYDSGNAGILTVCDSDSDENDDIMYEVKKIDEYYYVVAHMTMSDENSPCSKSNHTLDELCESRGKMRDDLDSIGLWDYNKFGTYTILECSY